LAGLVKDLAGLAKGLAGLVEGLAGLVEGLVKQEEPRTKLTHNPGVLDPPGRPVQEQRVHVNVQPPA